MFLDESFNKRQVCCLQEMVVITRNIVVGNKWEMVLPVLCILLHEADVLLFLFFGKEDIVVFPYLRVDISEGATIIIGPS